MADNQQLLIHELIDSVQQSIDIADRTSREKYNFALSEMEVKMTLQFEIKQDVTKITSKKRTWLSLFSRSNHPTKNMTRGDSDDDQAAMTLRMLFKPGGKAFVAASDSDAGGEGDGDSGSGSDSDSDS